MTQPFKTGDRVWIEMVKDHGVIKSFSRDGQRVMVEVDKVCLNIPRIALAAPLKGVSMAPKPAIRMVRRRGEVRREIDMHGLRVEDMISRLDSFLNDAILAGCSEVRVVHGYGSGALRKALHQHLRSIGIRRFRLGEPGQTPGGDGVTIIWL